MLQHIQLWGVWWWGGLRGITSVSVSRSAVVTFSLRQFKVDMLLPLNLESGFAYSAVPT